jgi:2-methylcitrate dehydratase PrpD
LAARDSELALISAELPSAARWSAVGHVLDFDDLHIESTSHISVVCVPATLATSGDAKAYLAGAGVMARLGMALGWSHYADGWHITCTAGPAAAAVAASMAMGLSEKQTSTAIALAVPASGGVVRAFGTSAKSLQVGFAAEAGVRAARLAAAGATADVGALDQWLGLVGAESSTIEVSGPAVPGGLAIKLFPCCYACQRPIDAVREQIGTRFDLKRISSIHVTTPADAVRPLIHARPTTGLEAKFSLQYAIASALLDGRPGFDSFSDRAVRRPEAQRLMSLVSTTLTPGGVGLLGGEVAVSICFDDHRVIEAHLTLPFGAPQRPPTDEAFAAKLAECGPDVPGLLADLDWDSARGILEAELPLSRPGVLDAAR